MSGNLGKPFRANSRREKAVCLRRNGAVVGLKEAAGAGNEACKSVLASADLRQIQPDADENMIAIARLTRSR